MAKPKAARRVSGVHKHADVKARRTTRRASGYQHRKKAKARRTTHRLVRGVLDFATHGLWPLRGSTQDVWLRVDQPREPGSGVFSPMLAALQNYVLARLECIQSWQRIGQTTGTLVSEDPFRRLMEARVQEATQRGVSDSTFQQVVGAANICDQVLEHLEKDERWRNVYRCTECGRWFFAWKHDPRNPQSPYCSRGCWPSSNSRDSLAPARRVQSRKK